MVLWLAQSFFDKIQPKFAQYGFMVSGISRKIFSQIGHKVDKSGLVGVIRANPNLAVSDLIGGHLSGLIVAPVLYRQAL